MAFDVLLTCPPMIGRLDHLSEPLAAADISITVPEFRQVVPEAELIKILPDYDGWIIGDDSATAATFAAGVAGKLRAAVKWGVGVDNVDFDGARAAGINVTNTPGAFSDEVADVAMGFLIMLARQLHVVSNGVRNGEWLKPAGSSMRDKTVALLGYGNIGRETARRLVAAGMNVMAYDPNYQADDKVAGSVTQKVWPEGVEDADYIVLTCSLNPATENIINAELLEKTKPGLRIVNVSRGALIDETALAAALDDGRVHSAALEVFQEEPPAANHPFLKYPQCVFGSHNGSNTVEAVDRASHVAIKLLREQLESPS